MHGTVSHLSPHLWPLCFPFSSPLILFSLFSPSPAAPCCPPSIRTMVVRRCGLRLRLALLLLRASTGRCAFTLHQSVGAVWALIPHIIIQCMMSRWSSTVKCPSLVGEVAMGIPLTRAPCPLLPATMIQQSHSYAGGEEWWITGMSSRLIRRTSCTTHHRPRGSSGSK